MQHITKTTIPALTVGFWLGFGLGFGLVFLVGVLFGFFFLQEGCLFFLWLSFLKENFIDKCIRSAYAMSLWEPDCKTASYCKYLYRANHSTIQI